MLVNSVHNPLEFHSFILQQKERNLVNNAYKLISWLSQYDQTNYPGKANISEDESQFVVHFKNLLNDILSLADIAILGRPIDYDRDIKQRLISQNRTSFPPDYLASNFPYIMWCFAYEGVTNNKDSYFEAAMQVPRIQIRTELGIELVQVFDRIVQNVYKKPFLPIDYSLQEDKELLNALLEFDQKWYQHMAGYFPIDQEEQKKEDDQIRQILACNGLVGSEVDWEDPSEFSEGMIVDDMENLSDPSSQYVIPVRTLSEIFINAFNMFSFQEGESISSDGSDEKYFRDFVSEISKVFIDLYIKTRITQDVLPSYKTQILSYLLLKTFYLQISKFSQVPSENVCERLYCLSREEFAELSNQISTCQSSLQITNFLENNIDFTFSQDSEISISEDFTQNEMRVAHRVLGKLKNAVYTFLQKDNERQGQLEKAIGKGVEYLGNVFVYSL